MVKGSRLLCHAFGITGVRCNSSDAIPPWRHIRGDIWVIEFYRYNRRENGNHCTAIFNSIISSFPAARRLRTALSPSSHLQKILRVAVDGLGFKVWGLRFRVRGTEIKLTIFWIYST